MATTQGWQEPLYLGCPKSTSPHSWASCSTAGLKGLACASCSSLFFVKEMSQSHVLTTPDFSSSVGALCVLAPLWGGQQWNLSCCSPGGHCPHQCCSRWGWQCYFLVSSRRKELLVPEVFHQVLCLRPRWISDVQDGAPDSRSSSQKLRATEHQCCTVTVSLLFLHGFLPPLPWKPALFLTTSNTKGVLHSKLLELWEYSISWWFPIHFFPS